MTGFEKETGCKVSVKTAATSDEMVSLMTKGGYDLVTASGDASLRLIAGKRVQPINTALIPNWKNIDPRLQNGGWYVVDKQVYGTLTNGAERAAVQHRRVQAGAHQLGRAVRAAEPSRRQAEQGPRAGLRWADLHRRCGVVPEGGCRSWASRTRTS